MAYTPARRDDMGFVYLAMAALAIGVCIYIWYSSHTDIVYYGLQFTYTQLSWLDFPFMPDAIREWKAEAAKLAAQPAKVTFDQFLSVMNKTGNLFVWFPILMAVHGIRLAGRHKAALTRRRITVQSLPWIMAQHSPAIIPTLYYGDKDTLLLNVDPEEHRSAINPEEWVEQQGVLVNGVLDRDKCRELFIEHLGTPFASLGDPAAAEKQAEEAEPTEEQSQPAPDPAPSLSVWQRMRGQASSATARMLEAAKQWRPEAAAKAEAAEPVQTQPEAETAQTAMIDINTASEAELTTLNNLGDVKAHEIVEFRKDNGPFTSVEDLIKVKGIGAALIEKNRARLTVSNLPKEEAQKDEDEESGEAKPEQAQGKPDGEAKSEQAQAILSQMQPQEKAMFAIFGTRLFAQDTDAEKVTAQDLLDRLNRSCHQNTWNGRKGYPDLSITDKAFAQYATHPDVSGWLQKHAYPRTLLHAMHKEALTTGKLPSSHFRWLKGMDRGLWYALNTTGRKAPFLESAAVFSQTLWEDLAHEHGYQLTEPYVDDAIDGLEAYLGKIGLLPRNKEGAKHG